MTPFNFKAAGSAAAHRLALLAAIASVVLAAPVGAQPPAAPAPAPQAPPASAAAQQQVTQALQAQVADR